MKSIDQYTIVMVVLTLGLLGTFIFTKDLMILDLTKVAFGATLGTLAKKAETTVLVSDPKALQAFTDKVLTS